MPPATVTRGTMSVSHSPMQVTESKNGLGGSGKKRKRNTLTEEQKTPLDIDGAATKRMRHLHIYTTPAPSSAPSASSPSSPSPPPSSSLGGSRGLGLGLSINTGVAATVLAPLSYRSLRVSVPEVAGDITALKTPTPPRTPRARAPSDSVFSSTCPTHSISSHRGSRRFMEDAWAAVPSSASREGAATTAGALLTGDTQQQKDSSSSSSSNHNNNKSSPGSFFGVFDGHGQQGQACAQLVAKELAGRIGVGSGGFQQASDVEAGLRAAFHETDQTCRSAIANGGTTATCAYIRDNSVWVANLGDSRCVLGRAGVAVNLTRDQKPDRADEKARVEGLGGRVVFCSQGWRVEGILGVSRSFGDYKLRPYVSAEPEVSHQALGPADDFLILATDGLWNVVTSQEAVDVVSKHTSPVLAGDALRSVASSRRSYDNLVVMVVDLKQIQTAQRAAVTEQAAAAAAASTTPVQG